MNGYSLTTWSNGFGIWHCKAVFDFPGVGNSPEAEAIKYKALAACKRAIRKEIVLREAPQNVGRLSYEIASNRLDSLNRMHEIVVCEK